MYSGNYDLLTTGAWSETRRRETEKAKGWDFHYYHHSSGWAPPSPPAQSSNPAWDTFKATANRFKTSGFFRELDGDNVKSPTDIFRCHAKMYIFADCYGISDLMELALNKLGQRLITFKLSDETVGDILDLLRYCDDATVPEELKSFVFLYAASQAQTLWKSPDFQECVLESRKLSMTLFNELLKTPAQGADRSSSNQTNNWGYSTSWNPDFSYGAWNW